VVKDTNLCRNYEEEKDLAKSNPETSSAREKGKRLRADS